MKNYYKFSLMSLAAATLLTACGGGSSSSSDSNVQGGDNSGNSNTDDKVVKSISGKAVDGYLQDSIVCLDLSMDGYCQIASEPTSNTDETGSYELTLSDEHRSHKNFDIASIVVYDGKDSDTGQRFSGKLQAPNNGEAINVTPITTLIAKAVDNVDENTSKEDVQKKIEEAQAKIKKVLKIPTNVDVNADPVKLKKEGNEDLIKASLALQKSMETLAKAALSDSSNTKREEELVEDMFKALADGLDEIDENDANALGLDKLIDKTKELEENKSEGERLIPNKALKVTETAKKIVGKVEISFANLDGDNELEILSTLLENDLKKLKEEFDNFDGSEDFSSSNVELDIDEKHEIFKETYDWDKEALKEQFSFLEGLKFLEDSVLDTLAEELKALGVKPHTLYKDSTIALLKQNSSKTNFEALIEGIEAEVQSWEDEQEEKEIQNSNEIEKITLPMTIYTAHNDREYNNGLVSNSYEYEKVVLGANNTINFTEYKLENNAWAVENDEKNNYFLDVNGTWQKRKKSDEELVLNDDGTINLPTMFEKVTLVKNKDLSNKKVYLEDLDLALTLPEGSNEYKMKIESTDVAVHLNEEKQTLHYSESEYITSFSQLIESRCGVRWFRGNEKGGIAFNGKKEIDDKISCDGSAKSGEIIEAYSNNGFPKTGKVAGTWKIENIRNQEVLVVYPYDLKKYAWDDDRVEYPAFALVKDGENSYIHQGNLEEKGHIENFNTYNEVAIEAIKTAIEAKGNSFEVNNYIANTISTPSNNQILEYGKKIEFKWDNSLLTGNKVNMYILHDSTEGLDASDSSSVKNKNWYKFAYQVENKGSLYIDPAYLHANGNEYKILIVSDDGKYSVSEGKFTVQPPSFAFDTVKLTKEDIAGKTFYNVFYEEDDKKHIMAEFNFSDNTFNVKEGDTNFENVAYEITEEGFITFILPDVNKREYIKVLSRDDKTMKILFVDDINEKNSEIEYLFSDKAMAENFLKEVNKYNETDGSDSSNNSSFPFTSEYLNTKTFYNLFFEEDEQVWKKATLSFTSSTLNISEGSENHTNIAYELVDNGIIKFTSPWDKDETEYIKAFNKSDEFLKVSWSDSLKDLHHNDLEYFYFDEQKADNELTLKNKEVSQNLSSVTLSGKVVFEDDNGVVKNVPSDARIRIVSKDDVYNHKWGNGFEAAISSDGTFTKTKNQYKNTYVDGNSFQVAIYRNTKEVDEGQWNCGEDLYKFVGSYESFNSWSNIVVKTSDYQDRSKEFCENK